MTSPIFEPTVYKKRRSHLAEFIPDCALLVASNPTAYRNSDVNHSFRQDSSVVYFTGFEEEETVFLHRPGRDPESILFVRSKNALAELWDGKRFGVEGAKSVFGVDAAYSIDEIEKILPDLLAPVSRLYYKFKTNPAMDTLVLNSIEQARRARGRTGLGVVPVFDPMEIIGEVRLIKQAEEISSLRRACDISAEAHIEAMRYTEPNVSERQVEAVLSFVFKNHGSARMGYDPIVGSGKNATVLHYKDNQDLCRDGELLLIDAGTEMNYYTADITRTFPVNGKFSSAQKDFYNTVLKAQLDVLEQVKMGSTFLDLQEAARKSLSQGIADLGLIKESAHKIFEEKLYTKYYPHNIGHWLGLDVHDVGAYYVNGAPRPLEAGMCFTVEPGLYVPADDMEAPKEFRGMGVRIEDNILITEQGYENLTKKCPKTIDAIESMMAEKSFFSEIKLFKRMMQPLLCGGIFM